MLMCVVHSRIHKRHHAVHESYGAQYAYYIYVCSSVLSQKESLNSYFICFKPALAFLNVFPLKTRGERLGKFLGFFGIANLEGVQVSGATDLELGLRSALADLDKLGITPACLL